MKRATQRDVSEKFNNFVSANTIKCKCGHSVFIRPTFKRKLCSWCGYWVYRNKLDEFKDKMQIQLKGDEVKCL